MQPHVLDGGFDDVAVQSAHAFRALMDVMARPGRIALLSGAAPPAPLSVAAGTLILALCDGETGIHLAPSVDTGAVRDWITFHTGAVFCAPEAAIFALGAWEEFDIARFPKGTAEYPDRSTTMIVQLAHLDHAGADLTGPGIRDAARLSLPERAAFQANAALFPRGLDFFFTCGDRVAALPRTTKVA